MKYVIPPSYSNESADLTSVAYVTRNDGDQIAMTFMRQAAFPQDGTHEFVMLQVGTINMDIGAARALHQTLGEMLYPHRAEPLAETPPQSEEEAQVTKKPRRK